MKLNTARKTTEPILATVVLEPERWFKEVVTPVRQLPENKTGQATGVAV